MPSFQYRAITERGTKTDGVLEAESADAAYQVLASRGLIPSKIGPAKGAGRGAKAKRRGKVKPEELILFTKQFKTMINAGISVIQALEVIETQTESARLQNAIIEIGRDIKEGASLHNAFSKHRGVFSELYCNMLRAGEMSGTLTQVLERLTYIIEHEFKVRKDIQSALTYPIIVVVALVVAFVILIMFVLPVFITMFKSQGIALPLPTRVCIGIHDAAKHYWMYILGGTGGAVAGIVAYCRTPRGRLRRDAFLLKLPILGKVFVKAALSRFASIFAILQSSGITVLESVSIISGTIGNAAVAAEFDKLKEKLEQGRGLSEPLRQAKYFTPLLVTMIAIGEESGQLEEMLREGAKHYDYEVEYSVKRMSELLGPALVAGLAGVIGFFALAIFLPLIELMQHAMGGMK